MLGAPYAALTNLPTHFTKLLATRARLPELGEARVHHWVREDVELAWGCHSVNNVVRTLQRVAVSWIARTYAGRLWRRAERVNTNPGAGGSNACATLHRAEGHEIRMP